MEKDELLPCPFCGEKARLKQSRDDGSFSSMISKHHGMQSYRVICEYCEAWGQPNMVKEAAIQGWNTRRNP